MTPKLHGCVRSRSKCFSTNVYPEAGVILDLLESLARHLTSLDVSSRRRLMEMKYNLLSKKVKSKDKKQVAELSFQALENGTYFCLDRVATNLENLEYSGISLNMENSGNSVHATSGKNCNKQSILVRHSNICVKQLLTG